MKLSEYIEDLQAMLELYGDHEVREQGPQAQTFRGDSVRAPRLRAKAVVTGGNYTGMEIHVQPERAAMFATQNRAELTGERVYVI